MSDMGHEVRTIKQNDDVFPESLRSLPKNRTPNEIFIQGEISDFTNEDIELPEASIMLEPVIKAKAMVIEGKLLTPDDPRALNKLQTLFSNWLIRNSEILSGEILSACALWSEIRGYFLKSNLISTRGQLSLTSISNNLILLSAKGTLSSAPGAANFL